MSGEGNNIRVKVNTNLQLLQTKIPHGSYQLGQLGHQAMAGRAMTNMKHLSPTPPTGHLTPGQKEGDNYQPNGTIHDCCKILV